MTDFSNVLSGEQATNEPTIDFSNILSGSQATVSETDLDFSNILSGSVTTGVGEVLQITNGPFEARPGEMIELVGERLDTVTELTYAGLSVPIESQSPGSLTFVVPDAFEKGLAFGFTHFVVVSDGENTDSTINTLRVPENTHDSGTVAGYDEIDPDWISWFDDVEIEVKDGHHWITFNPLDLDGLVTRDDGTFDSDDTGEFTGRVLDVEDDTGGPDGRWTELRTTIINESSLSHELSGASAGPVGTGAGSIEQVESFEESHTIAGASAGPVGAGAGAIEQEQVDEPELGHTLSGTSSGPVGTGSGEVEVLEVGTWNKTDKVEGVWTRV